MTDRSFKGVFNAWQDFCEDQVSCYKCLLRYHCGLGVEVRIPTDFEDSDIDFIEEYLDKTGYLYIKH